MVKLDEWDESARDALIRERAAAVGYYTNSETGEYFFSSLSLQQIGRADAWPEVAPKKENYLLHWQNAEALQRESQSATLLKEARPTPGLKTGWQGNVFFKLQDGRLRNAWKRYLPGMSIAAANADEFYWLAQGGLEPEPMWPGEAEKVGASHMGWQLWHLQMGQGNLEACAEWLWYRQIDMRYPSWRLSLLNPLSSISVEHTYTCVPGQPMLVRCDPPTRHMEQSQIHASLTLKPYQRDPVPPRQFTGTPAHSQSLVPQIENYFRAPAPLAHQEYRISLNGEASGLSMKVQTQFLPATPPAWLQGLRCTLILAKKQYALKSFRDQPTFMEAASKAYTFSVHQHFSLEQLAQATWNYQPSGIPCSLRWEYRTAQGQRYHGSTSTPLTADGTLMTWWKNSIWPEIADSAWVKLTLDAASFGCIALIFHLVEQKQAVEIAATHSIIAEQNQPTRVTSSAIQEFEKTSININHKAWWMNPAYTATLFWLSRIATQATGRSSQTTPAFSQALEQLCVPEMPEALKQALRRLAASNRLPIWVLLRLQALLENISITFTGTEQNKG